MNRRPIVVSIWVATLVIAASAAQVHRAPGTQPIAVPASAVNITRFVLANQTIFDGIARLSSEPLPLRLGFEEILRPKFADSPLPSPRFSLDLRDKTVTEIVQTLCTLDGRYAWALNGTTINVFPRATLGDDNYLLNRRIPELTLGGVTSIDQALLVISRQLPPPHEQIAIAEVGGNDRYANERWTESFQNASVRQVINHLAAQMGPRADWVFYGSRDFRSFAFFRNGFNARPIPTAHNGCRRTSGSRSSS